MLRRSRWIDAALARIRQGLSRRPAPPGPTFKDRNRELQELAKEVVVLRTNNLRFRDGDNLDQLLLFSEGAMILVTLERFLRAVLGTDATAADTLHNLLEKAMSEKRDDAIMPPGGDKEHVIELITGLRNGLLHGNFEQLTARARCKDNADYFKNRFARDVETTFKIMQTIVRQIDPDTGKVYEAQMFTRWRTRLVDALQRRRARQQWIATQRAKARST